MKRGPLSEIIYALITLGSILTHRIKYTAAGYVPQWWFFGWHNYRYKRPPRLKGAMTYCVFATAAGARGFFHSHGIYDFGEV